MTAILAALPSFGQLKLFRVGAQQVLNGSITLGTMVAPIALPGRSSRRWPHSSTAASSSSSSAQPRPDQGRDGGGAGAVRTGGAARADPVGARTTGRRQLP